MRLDFECPSNSKEVALLCVIMHLLGIFCVQPSCVFGWFLYAQQACSVDTFCVQSPIVFAYVLCVSSLCLWRRFVCNLPLLCEDFLCAVFHSLFVVSFEVTGGLGTCSHQMGGTPSPQKLVFKMQTSYNFRWFLGVYRLFE